MTKKDIPGIGRRRVIGNHALEGFTPDGLVKNVPTFHRHRGANPGETDARSQAGGEDVTPTKQQPELTPPPQQRDGGRIKKRRGSPLRKHAAGDAEEGGEPPEG